MDFAKVSELNFEQPDLDRFPNLAIAYRALKKGGTAPAALNAANEIAVSAFLDRRIRLDQIAEINGTVVEDHDPVAADSLMSVLDADSNARAAARAIVEGIHPSAASGNPV